MPILPQPGLEAGVSDSLSTAQQLLRRHLIYQLLINVLVLVAAFFLQRVQGSFHDFQHEQFNIVRWTVGTNLAGTLLLRMYVLRAHWLNRLGNVLIADAMFSVLPITLALIAHQTGMEHRVHPFGLVLGIFLFGKCAAWTALAACNASPADVPRRLSWYVFLTCLLVMGSFAPWYSLAVMPQGDEAHYTLLTYSLIHDHDFDLANNYAHSDHAEQWPPPEPGHDRGDTYAKEESDHKGGVPKEPHVVTNLRGQKLLWHDIGVPILLIPGYALGKRTGAEITLAIIASLLAVAVLQISLLLGVGMVPALVCTVIFTFTPPVYLFSETVIPEIFGAAGILWLAVFFLRYREAGGPACLLAAGWLTAILPWLCIRYWVLAGPLFLIFSAYVVYRCWGNWTGMAARLALLSAPSLAGLAVFAWFDHKYFNTYLPNAGYRIVVSYVPQFFAKPYLGLLGMFFDRTYGLLPTAPLYVAGFAGMIVLFRRDRWAAAALLLPCVTYIGFMSFSQYWWGGWNPPGRYLLSAIVLLIPTAGLVLRRRSAAFLGVLSLWTLFVTLLFTANPFTRWPSRFSTYYGSGLVDYFHDRTAMPHVYSLLSVYPYMLLTPSARQYLVACIWLIAYAAAAGWLAQVALQAPAHFRGSMSKPS